MTRTELKNKLENLSKVLDNVQQSLQFTNIPVYVLINYIKQESGIDMENVTTGRE